jgi:hypothetical protein
MGISLIDGLAQTEDKTRTHHIKFVTYNEDKQKGGQIIELPRAFRTTAKYDLEKQDMICVRQDNEDHPYTIHTHLIIEINHQPVYL